jgi:phospholipid/cholesterol/gamma-HCH transport system permease protein
MGEVDVTFRFIFEQMIETVEIPDLMHGLFKSVFFGYLIGSIGCWNGLKTTGGTEGVGIATTRTVVYTSIAILFSDFALTRLFLAIYG